MTSSTVPGHLDSHVSRLCIAAPPSEDLSSGAQVTKSLVRFHDPKISAYWRCFRLHDLPTELLIHIFRIFAWSTTDPSAQARRIMSLTWVCRYWRQTLISSATMWSVILFKHPPPYEQAFTWLERAGTSPLYVGIEERHSPEDNTTDDDDDIEAKFSAEQIAWLMDKLLEKLPQIRHLVIIVERRWTTAMALDKLALIRHSQEKLCLERLEIHRTGYPQLWHKELDSGPHRTPRKLLGGAEVPSLKHVVLNAVHVDWVNSRLSNLTHLDIRDIVRDLSPNERGFRDILWNCPNLVSLTLDGFGPRWTMIDTVFVPAVNLSHLRVLAMKNLPSEYALFVLAQFTAPHVRKLTLTGMDRQDTTPFLIALTSSFKELRMLELKNFDLSKRRRDKPAIIQWLDSMPDLEYLLADGLQPHFFDALFRYQVSDDPARPVVFYHQPLCPKLHTLEYYNMHPAVVLKFAVLRQERFVGLNRLYVGGLGFLPDESLKRCQVLSAPPVGEEEAEILRS